MVAAYPASALSPGAISVGWSIPGAPSSGLTNITFPITVNEATAHNDGLYFAQQYSFQHNAAGYIGLQPRPNADGSERLHGTFSVWASGASSTDPNCNGGADGSPGESCAVEFNAVYGHQYAVKVARTGTDTWTGTATDTVTGVSTHIGTYTVPTGSGNLQAGQGGFVEWYLGAPSCSTMARADGVFGGPTTTDAGGKSGTTKANYEYGACGGEANYQAHVDGTGTHVTRGAVSASSSGRAPATTPTTHPAKAPATAPTTGRATTSAGPDAQTTPSRDLSAQTTPTATPSADQALAHTGAGPALPIAGAGAGVLVVGAGLFWANRRRGNRRPRHT